MLSKILGLAKGSLRGYICFVGASYANPSLSKGLCGFQAKKGEYICFSFLGKMF